MYYPSYFLGMGIEETVAAPPKEETELTDGQELYRLNEDSHDDGTVTVRAHGWERLGDEKVRVYFITPTGDKMYEDMDWPDHGQMGKFVKVLTQVGYSLVNAEEFGNEGRKLRADPTTWTLQKSKTFRERALDHWHEIGDKHPLIFLIQLPLLYLYAHLLFIPILDTKFPKHTQRSRGDYEMGHYKGKIGKVIYKRDRATFVGIILNDLLWAGFLTFLAF